MLRKEKVRWGEGLALALIYGVLLRIITITVSSHGLYILNFCQHCSSYKSWLWSKYEMRKLSASYIQPCVPLLSHL